MLAFLLKYIPNAKLVEEVGTELTFMLPTHEGQITSFPEMFAQLETQKGALGINSYGVSDTTLEEVQKSLLSVQFNFLDFYSNLYQ